VAYNLESFELFVVSIPRARRVAGYTVVAGVLAGLLTYAALVAGSFDVEPATALVLAGTFVGSALLAGEAIQLLVGSYPRNWGQYLALVVLLVSAVFVPAAVLVGGSVQALWFALGVAFLLGFQILVVSDGLARFPRLGVASAVQPAAMAVGLTAAVPALSQDPATHAPPVAVVLAVGLGLGVVALFIEWLLDANVEAVGGLEISSKLVQRDHLHLGMGFPMEPTVQTLAVETDDQKTVVAAPWVHPGVVEGIGGGRLTRNLLARLNDEAQNGFFFHVPCTHRSDSADPTVYEPVGDAVTDPETDRQASRLLIRSVDGTTFSGRRYGDSRVVFVDSQEYNDIELGIFQDVIDPETTLVVDQHAHLDDDLENDLARDDPAADRLREQFVDFLDDLDDAPLAPYRAGHAVAHDSEDISLFALVEEVDGQRTLLLGADRNEAPHMLTEVRDEFADEYDETLLFTTDSHASVYANRFDPQAGPERIRTVITDAADSVADAAAGVDAERADTVDIMREDYTRLITSLNILARVFVVLLAGLHVVLAAALLLL
jgi:putative membrane protein